MWGDIAIAFLLSFITAFANKIFFGLSGANSKTAPFFISFLNSSLSRSVIISSIAKEGQKREKRNINDVKIIFFI